MKYKIGNKDDCSKQFHPRKHKNNLTKGAFGKINAHASKNLDLKVLPKSKRIKNEPEKV